MKQSTLTDKTLKAILVKDKETNTILYSFPPTKRGEKNANRFAGLTGIEIIKEYTERG